jgi:thioredoxin-like negative regulator of GroEL
MTLSSFTGVVKFTATWCGPCKAIQPQLTKACKELEIELLEVDVDAESEVATEYGISSIPVLVYLVDGKECNRVIGANWSSINEGLAKHAPLVTAVREELLKNRPNQIKLPTSDNATVTCQRTPYPPNAKR